MQHYTEVTYSDNSSTRIDRFLKTTYPTVPYSVIQKWFRMGSLRVNTKRIKADYRLQQGDILLIPPFNATSARPSPVKQTITDEIIDDAKSWLVYEDEEILAFNKPAGIAVQGGTGIKLSMDDLMRQAFNNPSLRIVHRLDKETSGLLIMAKDRASAQRFSKAFQDQEVKKSYVAIVVGSPAQKQGRIENYLSKIGDQFEKMAVIPEEDVLAAKAEKSAEKPAAKSTFKKKAQRDDKPIGDWSITDYQVLKKNRPYDLSLVRLQPQTGRTHQLRVHMAFIDTPIIGDEKYGGLRAHPFEEKTYMGLHAEDIKLPWGLELTAPWPEWFDDFF